MFSALLMVILVVAVGSRAADNLRVRQQEVILSKLPEADAVAYYAVLRTRVRKVMVMRAIALLAALGIVYAYKYRLVVAPAPVVTAPAATTPAR
jgi:hypothetical protein